MNTQTALVVITPAPRGEEPRLSLRIRSEFGEMPGLRLTLPQAARLFNVDRAQCRRVLDELVRNGDLVSDGASFILPGTGRQFI